MLGNSIIYAMYFVQVQPYPLPPAPPGPLNTSFQLHAILLQLLLLLFKAPCSFYRCLCANCRHGQPSSGCTTKEKWLSFLSNSSLVRGEVSGPFLSMLASWLAWSYEGLLQGTSVAMGSLSQRPRWVQKTAFHSTPIHPDSYIYKIPSLEGAAAAVIDVPFKVKHSTVTNSKYFGQWRVSVLTAAHCKKKKKFLWPRLRVSETCGYKLKD